MHYSLVYTLYTLYVLEQDACIEFEWQCDIMGVLY